MAEDPDPMAHDPVARAAELSLQLQRALERRAGQQGISATQAHLLQALRARTPTLGELARALELDTSSTSGLVDRAQRRGLVRRVPSQVDRRAVRVRLTDVGRDVAEAVWSAFARDLAAMLDRR